MFASYPFPITVPEYLVETMENNVVYRIVRDGPGGLVAAASAETDPEHRNAEMTDLDTLPSQRGFGLAQHILAALEVDMTERGLFIVPFAMDPSNPDILWTGGSRPWRTTNGAARWVLVARRSAARPSLRSPGVEVRS